MSDVWPLRPLRDLLVDGPVPDAELAGILRCDKRTLYVWRNGGVPTFDADRLACRVAYRHPAEVWPGWYAAEEES